MGQAFYTSIGGINSAQTQLNVIANNVANINTAGFKSSSVNFADVYYNTLSFGSAPTKELGGTNPRQIGLGVMVNGISKNFTDGSVVSTGKITDMNIQGTGFFCVQSAEGEIMYTRVGDFSIDSDGTLVNSSGYKVIGTTSNLSTVSGTEAVKIPTLINTKTIANSEDLTTKDLSELNGINLAKGSFTINTTIDGTKMDIDIDISSAKNLSDIVNTIKKRLGDNGISEDNLSIKCDNTTGGKIEFSSSDKCTSFSIADGSSNFGEATGLSGATKNTNGVYSSNVLDYKQVVTNASSLSEAKSYSGVTFYENGSVEVSYSNGDKLTVTYNEKTNSNEFKYTTSSGVIIKGNDVKISESLCKPENLQIQLAKFINPEGLIAQGSNLYSASANAGAAFYGTPSDSGFGPIKTGGYEGSNVDLSTQLANMIQSQRSIEANSRVFSTTNEILKTLVYIGQ